MPDIVKYLVYERLVRLACTFAVLHPMVVLVQRHCYSRTYIRRQGIRQCELRPGVHNLKPVHSETFNRWRLFRHHMQR